jgi:hypothetical protein
LPGSSRVLIVAALGARAPTRARRVNATYRPGTVIERCYAEAIARGASNGFAWQPALTRDVAIGRGTVPRRRFIHQIHQQGVPHAMPRRSQRRAAATAPQQGTKNAIGDAATRVKLALAFASPHRRLDAGSRDRTVKLPVQCLFYNG